MPRLSIDGLKRVKPKNKMYQGFCLLLGLFLCWQTFLSRSGSIKQAELYSRDFPRNRGRAQNKLFFHAPHLD